MPKSKYKKAAKNLPHNTAPLTDPICLLPREVRSMIYEFTSEALTVHVRRKLRGRGTGYGSLLLSLPRDQRYIAFCRKYPWKDARWSPSIEKAFFTGTSL